MLCRPRQQQAAQECLTDAQQEVPQRTQQAEDEAADTLCLDAGSDGKLSHTMPMALRHPMQDWMGEACCAMPAETAGRPPQSRNSLRSDSQASRIAQQQSSSLKAFTCAFCKESLGMALKLLRSQHEHDPFWFC